MQGGYFAKWRLFFTEYKVVYDCNPQFLGHLEKFADETSQMYALRAPINPVHIGQNLPRWTPTRPAPLARSVIVGMSITWGSTLVT